MKKPLSIILALLLIFTFTTITTFAQNDENTDTEQEVAAEENLEDLDLSQEKGFSEEGRDQLLGIASQFDNQTAVDDIDIDSESFSITGDGTASNPGMHLLQDLTLDADYSEAVVDSKLEKETGLQLEYAINSRALIRAGYTLANKEWWEKQTLNTEESSSETSSIGSEENTQLLGENAELLSVNSNNSESVFIEEQDVRRSLGLAYRTSDQLTVSADYIENNEFDGYSGDNEFQGNSTVFGLQYDDQMGSIRAIYQLNLGEDVRQQITGVELDFNNLATFSASYKLLDPEEIESALSSQTAWDLGLGVNLNENYGLNLGYEIIEDEDEETEPETNISASFEINF